MPRKKSGKSAEHAEEYLNGLTPSQVIAATHLGCGSSQEAAAKAASTSCTSIKRWYAEQPAFVKLIAETTDDVTRRVRVLMQTVMAEGMEHLRDLMKGRTDRPEQQRLKAIEMALQHGITLSELGEMKQRLAALEKGGNA